MKINKILVPVDFSACSRNALVYATKLAQKTNATLHLLHGYYQPVPTIDIPVAAGPYNQDQEQLIQDSWIELADQVPVLSEISYSHETQTGFLTDVVLRKLEEEQFDLIVMGTKGSSNRLDKMLGSNAYNIVKEVTIPVIVVPPDNSFKGFDHIALAADFKGIKELSDLDIIKAIATEFNSELHLLHVSEEAQNLEIEEAGAALDLNNYFKGLKHSFEFVTKKNIVEGIEKYVERNNVDLTVLIPRHHSLLEKLFKQRVTRKSVLNANMTILALHQP